MAVALFNVIPKKNQSDSEQIENEDGYAMEAVVEAPELLYDIDISNYEVLEGRIKRNQTIADILSPYNVSQQEIYQLDRESQKVYSVRNFVPRRKYTLLYSEDSIKKAAYFIYEPNSLEYVVYSFVDGVDIYRDEKEVEIIERTMTGRITQSLDHAIRQEGGSAALVSEVADVFGWQLDFYALQRNDWFKVIYEEKRVDGESIGIGRVISAQFNHLNNNYMAYAYDSGDGIDYYDASGESVQRAFLRWPVEFSRISSRYSKGRFHPVLKRRTAHLGTDFAADKGTPIKAAADGVVLVSGYTKANGNWVKIRHNGTYTTGYLHMSRRGKFKAGQRVKKGDVIGYVGKTGLATGYHLCFRFWKRGRQVDFLNEKEKLPSENPITEEHRARFEALMELQNKKLNDIPQAWADGTVSASAN